MSRRDLFEAVRLFAPNGKFSLKAVEITDALADEFGMPRDAAAPSNGVSVDPQLVADLKRDEGCRLKAYKDTVGVWTVGYGHAHVAPGTVWTQAQADEMLVKDIIKHNAELELEIPWIKNLDPVRRRVLQNMAFNLGVGSATSGKGLLGFKNTLEAVRTGNYERAALGMASSKWASQVHDRAERLVAQMRTGK